MITNQRKQDVQRKVGRARQAESGEKTTVGGYLTVCKYIKDCYRKRTGANYSH